MNHGIIGNWYYDKFLKKSIYCVDDINYKTVSPTSNKRKSKRDNPIIDIAPTLSNLL